VKDGLETSVAVFSYRALSLVQSQYKKRSVLEWREESWLTQRDIKMGVGFHLASQLRSLAGAPLECWDEDCEVVSGLCGRRSVVT